MTEERFDQLLKDMREEAAPPEQVADACERVRRQIAGSTSMACAEFRPEFGDYIAGRLTDSRRLLIDDHLGRCAECRRVLAEAKGERRVVSMPQSRVSRWPGWTRWAVAAGVAAAALYLGRDNIDARPRAVRSASDSGLCFGRALPFAAKLLAGRGYTFRAGRDPHHGRLSRDHPTCRRLPRRVEPAHRAFRSSRLERPDDPSRSRRRHRAGRQAAPRVISA